MSDTDRLAEIKRTCDEVDASPWAGIATQDSLRPKATHADVKWLISELEQARERIVELKAAIRLHVASQHILEGEIGELKDRAVQYRQMTAARIAELEAEVYAARVRGGEIIEV